MHNFVVKIFLDKIFQAEGLQAFTIHQLDHDRLNFDRGMALIAR
jgi:hypothetical protein